MLTRPSAKLWPVWLGMTALTLATYACRSAGGGQDSDAKFGWDENLADPNTKPGPAPGGDAAPRIDTGFCQNARPGSCFTLLMRVPKSEFVQDLGLSVLALGNASRSLRSRIDEACRTAFSEYRQRHMFDNMAPLRARFVKNVEKMRCAFVFMDDEADGEQQKLGPSEIALSVRMTKFEIEGDERGGSVRGIGLKLNRSKVSSSFRSVALFGANAEAATGHRWQTALGLGVAPLKVQKELARDISWQFDWTALGQNLEKVAADAPGMQAGMAAFFTQAKDQLRAAAGPGAGAIAMISVGYNAYRTLCGENREQCKAYANTSVLTPGMSEDLSDLIPSSDSNELLRLAVLRSVEATLDRVFVGADAKQLSQAFLLP